MTTPIEETYVVVDADLDTADDDFEHGFHGPCNPSWTAGPRVAYCGELMIWDGLIEEDPPANGACPRCIALMGRDICALCV